MLWITNVVTKSALLYLEELSLVEIVGLLLKLLASKRGTAASGVLASAALGDRLSSVLTAERGM